MSELPTGGGVGLVLVAAGSGTRLGAGRPKALVPIPLEADQPASGEPVVVHALRGALTCPDLTRVVVVGPPEPRAATELQRALQVVPLPPQVHLVVVPGGAERSDSVALGLQALAQEVGVVLVHDAARALTPPEVFSEVLHAVRDGHAAVTPALPVTDTIKQVEPDPAGGETVVATVERAALRAVQTPQGFLRETLERAHREVTGAVTDDCGMVEALGGRVHVVPGSPRAMKITTPYDLELAGAWLRLERATGHGA